MAEFCSLCNTVDWIDIDVEKLHEEHVVPYLKENSLSILETPQEMKVGLCEGCELYSIIYKKTLEVFGKYAEDLEKPGVLRLIGNIDSKTFKLNLLNEI